MKSAYELAMERLNASNPNKDAPLTEAQKEELADLDNKYKARIAERKISAEKRIADASAKRDYQSIAAAKNELQADIQRIETDRESAKERVRKGTQQGA